MPRLGTRHYAYTPAGRAAYLRDKKNGIDESGLGTDGLEGFKSAKEEIAKRRKTKQRTKSKY